MLSFCPSRPSHAGIPPWTDGRPGGECSIHRFLRSFPFLAILTLVVSTAWPLLAEQEPRVRIHSTSLLTEPGREGHRITRLYKGHPVRVVDELSNEHYVEVEANGHRGWIFRRYLTYEPPPEDLYPPRSGMVEQGFLRADRNGNGQPDFRDVVRNARSFIGSFFDDFNNIGGPTGPYQAAADRSRWAQTLQRFGPDVAGPPPFSPDGPMFEIVIPESDNIPDGVHWKWSQDGLDNNGDGRVDDPLEELLVCIDLCTASYERAGYPITSELLDHHRIPREDRIQWSPGIWVSRRKPYLSRNLGYLVPFLKRSKNWRYFSEPKLDSPDDRPREPFRPGDMVFFGLTEDLGTRKFRLCHSGIVSTVDPDTGMPLRMITAVVPRVMDFQLDNSYDRFIILGHARPVYLDVVEDAPVAE